MITPTILTNVTNIARYKSITANINGAKQLEPFILDAQEFDVRAFLGAELYLELLDQYDASPQFGGTDTAYAKLFNGSEYTVNGKRRNHPGIEAVLIHFAYARYCENANSISTKAGFKTKTNEWSNDLSEKSIARKIQQAKSAAVALQERVKDFLDENESDYEGWYGGKRRRRGSMRITAVGGNSRQPKYKGEDCAAVRTVEVPGEGCGPDYVESGYVL